MENEIRDRIYNFFIESRDFNGIPLRQVSQEFNIDYKESIDLIKNLVSNNTVSIQSSTNPHIIGFKHHSIENQNKVLEDAKKVTNSVEDLGIISISIENTQFPICLYPSREYLKTKRDLSEFKSKEYTKLLALGEPQLSPKFFNIEVLERYANDPRFNFEFEDYAGSISCKYDENGNPVLSEEDQVFIKTFGLGFDSQQDRLAVVYLRYLKDLTAEHQLYWNNKEVEGNCKVLKEYYENSILGNWTISYSIFSAFLGELTCLNNLANKIFGRNLFRKNFENENRPKEFTFFFLPTLRNYNEFVLLLDKMISDNINKDFFKGKVELYELIYLDDNLVEKKDKATLRLFEEWMLLTYKVQDKQTLKDIFKPLKKIRRERQNPAHKISENDYNKKYINKQKEMINDSYESIKALRQIFQQHPKAKGVEIPDWLDNGEIKIF